MSLPSITQYSFKWEDSNGYIIVTKVYVGAEVNKDVAIEFDTSIEMDLALVEFMNSCYVKYNGESSYLVLDALVKDIGVSISTEFHKDWYLYTKVDWVVWSCVYLSLLFSVYRTGNLTMSMKLLSRLLDKYKGDDDLRSAIDLVSPFMAPSTVTDNITRHSFSTSLCYLLAEMENDITTVMSMQLSHLLSEMDVDILFADSDCVRNLLKEAGVDDVEPLNMLLNRYVLAKQESLAAGTSNIFNEFELKSTLLNMNDVIEGFSSIIHMINDEPADDVYLTIDVLNGVNVFTLICYQYNGSLTAHWVKDVELFTLRCLLYIKRALQERILFSNALSPYYDELNNKLRVCDFNVEWAMPVFQDE